MNMMPFASRFAIRKEQGVLARQPAPPNSTPESLPGRSHVLARTPVGIAASRLPDDVPAVWEQSLLRPNRLGRILVASDDKKMRGRLGDGLLKERCDAVVTSSDHVMRELQQWQFSLVILDVGTGNLAALTRIRMQSCVPVVLISERESSEIDYILGLEMGADDYLFGPIGIRMLLARAHALLRRQELAKEGAGGPVRRGYRFDGWELHHRSKSLRNPDGRPVVLTKIEFALLIAFLEAPGRVLTRLHLMRATRAHEDIFDRSVDVQVLRLRRRLAAEPSNPRWIRTVRGAGYVLDVDVETLF